MTKVLEKPQEWTGLLGEVDVTSCTSGEGSSLVGGEWELQSRLGAAEAKVQVRPA